MDPNQRIKEWFNSVPVSWASAMGKVNALKELVLQGADIFANEDDALKSAIRERYPDCAYFIEGCKIVCETTKNSYNKVKDWAKNYKCPAE